VRPLEGRYILRDLPAFPLVDFNAVTLAEAVEAMELLLDKMGKTKSDAEFVSSMSGQ